jgi:hypothetical protein
MRDRPSHANLADGLVEVLGGLGGKGQEPTIIWLCLQPTCGQNQQVVPQDSGEQVRLRPTGARGMRIRPKTQSRSREDTPVALERFTGSGIRRLTLPGTCVWGGCTHSGRIADQDVPVAVEQGTRRQFLDQGTVDARSCRESEVRPGPVAAPCGCPMWWARRTRVRRSNS